jgi:ADP-heptose:LPS heptosyltransferase
MPRSPLHRLGRKVWQTLAYAVWRIYRMVTGPGRIPADVREILLLPVGGIGNVVLVTPLIDTLRQRYPGARITVVLRSRGGAEILRAFPDMRVYEFDFAGGAAVRRFVRDQRLPRYDLAFNCETFYGALLAALCRTRCLVSFTYSFGVTAHSDFLCRRARPIDTRQDEVRQYLDLLHLLGDVPPGPPPAPRLVLLPEDERYAADLLREVPEERMRIGLHIGSLPQVPEKRWAPERFAEVAAALAREYGAVILLFGERGEEETRNRFLTALGRSVVLLDLVGRCSVRQTTAAMRRCALFVGNDSGPMHLAAAVGTPVVAVFGPTDPRKNAPWGDPAHHVVVREDLPCSPCYRPYSGRVVCTNPLHLECLDRITVERVLQAARGILESIPKP